MIKVSRIAPEALHAVRVVLKYKMKDWSFLRKDHVSAARNCVHISWLRLSLLCSKPGGGGESSQVKGGVGRGLEGGWKLEIVRENGPKMIHSWDVDKL